MLRAGCELRRRGRGIACTRRPARPRRAQTARARIRARAPKSNAFARRNIGFSRALSFGVSRKERCRGWGELTWRVKSLGSGMLSKIAQVGNWPSWTHPSGRNESTRSCSVRLADIPIDAGPPTSGLIQLRLRLRFAIQRSEPPRTHQCGGSQRYRPAQHLPFSGLGRCEISSSSFPPKHETVICHFQLLSISAQPPQILTR